MNQILDQLKKCLESGNQSLFTSLAQKHSTELEGNAFFWLYQGAYLLGNNQYSEALQAFERSIKLDESLIAPHKNKALCYHFLKDAQAFKSLCLALWLDPQDTSFAKLLCSSYPDQAQFKDYDIVFYTGTPWLGIDLTPLSLNSALGGSETAFLVMANEMYKKGHKVACFCNTKSRSHHNGIDYFPVEEFFLFSHQKKIPTFISLRFSHPFGKGIKADKKILWIQETLGCANKTDLIKPYINEINAVFALSDYQIKSTAKYHNIPENRFYKTRNGYVPELFKTNSKKSNQLCYISRPERGLKEAIAICELLAPEIPDLKLHVCNYTQWANIDSDPYMSPIKHLLSKDFIVYHGGLSKKDVASLLSSSELMIYPNVGDGETSCIAAIESQAAATPVIASNRGALPETVLNNIGGKIIPYSESPNFIQLMAAEIKKLLQNKSELEKLALAAQARAQEWYPWPKIADEWIQFIATLS